MTHPDGGGRPPTGIIFAKFNSEKAGPPICANISIRCGSKMPLRASVIKLRLGSDTPGSPQDDVKSQNLGVTVTQVVIKYGKVLPSYYKVLCPLSLMCSSEGGHQSHSAEECPAGLSAPKHPHMSPSLSLVLGIALHRGLEHPSLSLCYLPLSISPPFYCAC